MMFSFETLRGYELAASDDTVGEVKDLYFDDRFWIVRYLVVRTGGWLSGREVLIAPECASAPDHAEKQVPVTLSRSQVKDAPGIATDLPVEVQNERALRDHFGWASDWAAHPAGLGAGPLLYPGLFPGTDGLDEGFERVGDEPAGDPNLHSAHGLVGYRIEASDGEIGSVSDFLVDEDGWVLRYLVIDTGKWLSGRKVLIAPNWAREIDWAERVLRVSVEREQVENSPTYDPDKHPDRAYETALHGHYGRPVYWP